MTTIAYRNGVLAADSQASDSQVWRTRKIERLDTEAGELLVGWCGEVFAAQVFIEWLKDNKNRKPDIGNEDFEAIVIAKTGRVTIWNQSMVPWKPRASYYALGSGAGPALGAMWAGKGAIAAVQAACKHDPYSSAPIHSLKLAR